MDADPSGRAVLGRGSVVSRLLGLRFGIPAGAWSRVSCECCVLSRDRCVGLITRSEESCRMWCERERETSVMRRPWTTRGCCAMGGGGNSN
jgi:hypothetical protein